MFSWKCFAMRQFLGRSFIYKSKLKSTSFGHELCSIRNWLKYSEVPLATCYTIRGTHQVSHYRLS